MLCGRYATTDVAPYIQKHWVHERANRIRTNMDIIVFAKDLEIFVFSVILGKDLEIRVSHLKEIHSDIRGISFILT